jgi:hypothetical protein
LNAPALDSETEIELTIENRGRMILDCRSWTICRRRWSQSRKRCG